MKDLDNLVAIQGANNLKEAMKKSQGKQYWEVIIKEQEGSGKSVAAYCRDSGIKCSTFWTWEKKLRRSLDAEGSLALTGGSKAVLLNQVAAKIKGKKFVEVLPGIGIKKARGWGLPEIIKFELQVLRFKCRFEVSL